MLRTQLVAVADLWRLLSTLCLTASLALGSAHAQSTSSPSATGSHDVVVNGVRVWYRVAGKTERGTPPVIFLHGGPGYNSYSFSVQAGPALEQSLRMVYLDQRGAGKSERPWNGQYSLATLASDIDEIRKGLGVPKVSIIGHSFGGTLALEYAATYPDQVARVVIVSGASDLSAACGARRKWLEENRAAAVARLVADTAARKGRPVTNCTVAFEAIKDRDDFAVYNQSVMFPNPAIGRTLDSLDAASGLRNTGEQQRALFANGLLEHRFDKPARLTMPVLIIAGAHDFAIGLDQQRALAKILPQATILEYERAGHFLYLDEPDRFTRDVTNFLLKK